MSQLKSGQTGILAEAKAGASSSSVNGRKGWYSNGCPMDGTKLRMRNDKGKWGTCQRVIDNLILGCDNGDDGLQSQAFFRGDQFIPHGNGDGWEIKDFIPIDE